MALGALAQRATPDGRAPVLAAASAVDDHRQRRGAAIVGLSTTVNATR
jgi:hypothetical protein